MTTRTFKTRERVNGDIHFWRHTDTTLETHTRGNPWRITDTNVTDPRTHIRLCGFDIIKDSGA